MKKILFIAIIIFISVTPISAEVISRESIGIDETLAQKDIANYLEPERIVLTQISTDAVELGSDSKVWASQIYYYYITRLGFVDIPYNYLLSEDGKLYQGRSGYIGIVPELDSPDSVILIGYMSNNPKLSNLARQELGVFIESIGGYYDISKKSISVASIQFIEPKEGTSGKLKLVNDSSSTFARDVAEAVELMFADISYDEIDRNYSAAVTVSDYEKKAKSGGIVEINAQIKNNGEAPLYLENSPLFVRTLDGKDSEFSINGEWGSASVATIIDDGYLLPGQSKDFKFSLYAGVFPTEEGKPHEQSFILGVRRKEKTYLVNDSGFSVSFEVEKGEFDIIKITETGVGYINMRACPQRNCDIVSTIPVGERVIAKEYGDSWIKVQYQEKEGWIVSSYHKKL